MSSRRPVVMGLTPGRREGDATLGPNNPEDRLEGFDPAFVDRLFGARADHRPALFDPAC
jgi:hypothetical protein